ncbi:release factor glutamine methyltransferase [Priestia megaterium]|nr:release factor glutamine methyltransferase [Priestia megaterium]
MEKQINYYIDKKTEKWIINKLRTAGCVFAEDEARLLISEAQTLDTLIGMVEQRATGLPLEHVVGWADFCGMRIKVEQGVFVPRRRTEFLVQQTSALATPGSVIVDLCCGTGAVGVALAKIIGYIELYATDIDPASVRCAYHNTTFIGGNVYEGDLYHPLPSALHNRVDILVANAPYVPTESIELLPQEARKYEIRAALDGGEKGLDVQRRVAAEAPIWLAPGGHLLVETSQKQALQTAEIFAENGLIPKVANCVELDATVVIGTQTNRTNMNCKILT